MRVAMALRGISIHALRKESDRAEGGGRLLAGISIHALRKESDFRSSMVCSRGRLFQSTLSVRRATRRGSAVWRRA